MKNVLHSFIIYRLNSSGLSIYHFPPDSSQNINCPEIEKVSAVLVLIHLRVMVSFSEADLDKVSSEVFGLLVNLVLGKMFLKYFMEDDQSQIDWRMSFFD